MYLPSCNISVLVGKTLTAIHKGDDVIVFHTSEGEVYKMYHQQDCCESVSIEDINGDLNDLLNYPILVAEERASNDKDPNIPKSEYDDSFTWTFYTIRNVQASVDIRWYGTSNGYYSESVIFSKI